MRITWIPKSPSTRKPLGAGRKKPVPGHPTTKILTTRSIYRIWPGRCRRQQKKKLQVRVELGSGDALRAAFFTFGCKVNQFDTQGLAAKFRRKGFAVVSSGEPADIYVINTCTVTKTAEQKARQLIRKIRKQYPRALLVVTGCYARTNPDTVKDLPGVGVVTGVDRKSTRLNSSHVRISYAVFCLKKKSPSGRPTSSLRHATRPSPGAK